MSDFGWSGEGDLEILVAGQIVFFVFESSSPSGEEDPAFIGLPKSDRLSNFLP